MHIYIPSPLKRILITGILLTLVGCATNPVTGEKDFVLMSEESEIALGRKGSAQILEQYDTYNDPALSAYVQRIGEKVAAISHRTGLIYRFTVLDSNEVNAFALPGGYIYITRGLLAYLNSEAELAAVLGHELGHVTARHSVRQHSTAMATGLLGAIIAAKSGVQGAEDISNILGTAIVRGYGREHELEADRLGAEYLAKSGYNPNAMIKVIKVLKNQEIFEKQLAKKENREANVYHGVFSTHPDNDKRLHEVISSANKFYNVAKSNHTNRDQFLGHIDNLVFGDSEKEGIRRGSSFYHKDLNFVIKFPDGWVIKNSPSKLVVSSPVNDGVLQLLTTDLNKRISPREFMQKRLELTSLSNGEYLRVGGNLEAYTANVNLNLGYGPRNSRVTVIYYNNKAYILAGSAKNSPQQYTYDRLFLQAARSFHPMTSSERKLAKSLRLRIIKASSNTRFSELARNSRIPNYPDEQLRLLNGLYPSGEPVTGQKIKIVQ